MSAHCFLSCPALLYSLLIERCTAQIFLFFLTSRVSHRVNTAASPHACYTLIKSFCWSLNSMKLNFAIGLAIAVTVAEARTNPHFSWTNSTSNTNRIFGVYNNTNASAANTTLRRIPHRPQSSASQVYVVAVSQIADGQVQAPASTAPSVTPALSATVVSHVAFNSSSRAPASRIFTYHNASIGTSSPAPSSSVFNLNKTAHVLPAKSASKGRPFTPGTPASWLVNSTTAGATGTRIYFHSRF